MELTYNALKAISNVSNVECRGSQMHNQCKNAKCIAMDMNVEEQKPRALGAKTTRVGSL